MARITKSAARLVLLSVLITGGCSKREAPQYDLINCIHHLSELDPEARAECVHYWAQDPKSPWSLHAGAEDEEQRIEREQAQNPEDRRLDARGIK